ncbi:MAG TPA: efflux RND transporter periplasmic adaptor subunit [Candidatus Acidoferrales bacterium]|nr:efflux RND transporter periplasmic adaptor subunit [Candidatus Acidoferrales bacterium]
MKKRLRCAISRVSLAAVIGLGALFSSCSKHEGVEADSPKASELPTVAVARVQTENLSHNLVLTAEFKPYQEVDVMAKVAGYIKEINVDVGDRVRENQLLATLEIPEMADDLRRADAGVKRSQAEVRRADDELKRTESAHDIAHLSYQRLKAVVEKRPGLVAQQDIDDAQSKDLVAEAQVSAAKSARAVAQEQVQVNQSEQERVKTLIDYTRVTAPFTGVVTKRYADKGSMIQAGTASQTQAMPVVRLSENSLLRLILPVPESVVPTVHIGQQVEVRVPSLNRSFPGKVARFADKLSLATRTMDTEVDVQNPSLVLIPGMYAEVNLALAQRNGVLAIPVTAVDLDNDSSQTDGGKPAMTTGRVMVVTPNNRVESRQIEVGLETANKVEVRAGLNDGDLVVIGGRAGLQAGQEVRPKVTVMAAINQ